MFHSSKKNRYADNTYISDDPYSDGQRGVLHLSLSEFTFASEGSDTLYVAPNWEVRK